MIYSLRIIRKENQVVPAEYIKQFWMFCGVYVQELILDFHGNIRDEQKVDCNIWMTEHRNTDKKTFENLRAKAKKNVRIKIDEEYNLSSKEKRLNFGKNIRTQMLEKITNKDEDIYEIYDIFVKHDIAYINFLSHLYLNQYDKTKKEKCLDDWLNCLNDFYVVGADFDGSVFKKFAYLNCCRKVNRVCAANRQIPYFDTETIMKVAHGLSDEDKNFSMGNVLAGLTGLVDYETEMTGEEYLQQAINREHGKRYTGFVYYALGHHYEIDKHDWKFGWIWYKKIESADDTKNIKYVFKCIGKNIRNNDDDIAWKKLSGLYKALEERHKSDYMSLAEMEYWYRCVRMMEEMAKSKGYLLSGMKSEEIVNLIDSNIFVQKFVDTGDKHDICCFYQLKMA